MISKEDSGATNMTGSVVSELDLGTFIYLPFLKEKCLMSEGVEADLTL